MPPNEPAESMVPAKNARFSGRFDRCTCASSSRASASLHLKAFATTAMFSAWLSRRRRLPSRMPCTRPFTISGCALAKPLFTASTSATTSRLRFDTSTLAAPFEASITSSVFGVQPTQPLSRRAAARELMLIGVAGDERILVEHQAERAGRGLRIEIAQHGHRHAGFLREITDEELALVELRGGQRLAVERVDRGDAAIDDHHVGAARVADLHGHHGVELPAEHGQRIGRGGGGREPAVVERTTRFRSSLIEICDLEAVFLGEERIRRSARGRRSRRSGRRNRRIR